MSQAEFNSLKRWLLKKQPIVGTSTKEILKDDLYVDTYTSIQKDSDYDRHRADIAMTTAEIKKKIRIQLQNEKQKCVFMQDKNPISWETLLKSKLINKIYL